jgi:hypothetical protein
VSMMSDDPTRDATMAILRKSDIVRVIADEIRSAQSQARDEALEEAAASLDSYSSPTDVGEEMAHMFARRVRALKASKP